MLTLLELKKLSSKESISQGIIEKDYVLSVALNLISQSPFSKNLIFKGGTAIKKIYFNDARFSEDLDFNINSITKENIKNNINNLFANKTIKGITFDSVEEIKTPQGLKIALKYRGPLNYKQRIKFDFNFRKNLIEEPVEREIIDTYNLGVSKIQTLTLNEIMSEKIHGLGSRNAPRDLYDIYFLSNNNVKIDYELVEKKYSYYNEKFNKDDIKINIQKMKNYWARDLGPLLKNLPEFDLIEKKVIGLL